MKRKIEITFETEELVLSRSRGILQSVCPHCQTLVEFQPIEDSETQFIEAEKVLTCRNSSKDSANIIENFEEVL